MKKITLAVLAALFTGPIFSQDSTAEKPNLSWTVFADTYYSYDLNQPEKHQKPSFLYNHNRHNEVNLNLGLIQAAYTAENVRGTMGLMVGTYAQYNYAAEEGLLKNVFQANAGVKISRTSNLWIDAGILPSHIGYESAISKDNWTLTRSLAAENSPYFETGAKISYTTKDSRWLLSGLVLNGWQRIRRPDGNNTPAFGTQLTYTPSAKALFNWSSFVGNDYPTAERKWRYFNDFYAIFQPSESLGITVGFDLGLEQSAKGSSKLNAWYAPSVVLRFTPSDSWAIAARGEYYSDKNGVIVAGGSPNGFKTIGASLNLDRKVAGRFWWRTEVRTLNSKDAIFTRTGKAVNGNSFLTTSFAITF